MDVVLTFRNLLRAVVVAAWPFLAVHGLLPTEIRTISDAPLSISTLCPIFPSEVGVVKEAIAFLTAPASLTDIGHDAGGIRFNSSALIVHPASTLTPFNVPTVTRKSPSPNTF